MKIKTSDYGFKSTLRIQNKAHDGDSSGVVSLNLMIKVNGCESTRLTFVGHIINDDKNYVVQNNELVLMAILDVSMSSYS